VEILAQAKKKYRFLFIQPFELPRGSRFADPYHSDALSKDERMRMKHLDIRHLLEDVEWDFHGGPIAPYGDWAVETREEFAHVAAARLPIVREACESGRYNAIVLLGGGEPGFMESREIAHKYGIAVSSCAFSQMHIASMLGNKFSVIDFAESHNMYYHDLVVRHRFADRCASIRCVNYYHARPGHADESTMADEREKALRGEPSEAVERAVAEAVAAIEEDGAEVITSDARTLSGCSRSSKSAWQRWAGRRRCWRATVAPSCWRSSTSISASTQAGSCFRAIARGAGAERRFFEKQGQGHAWQEKSRGKAATADI